MLIFQNIYNVKAFFHLLNRQTSIKERSAIGDVVLLKRVFRLLAWYCFPEVVNRLLVMMIPVYFQRLKKLV